MKLEHATGKICTPFCQCCGETKKEKFFKSQSGLHSSGCLPICKKCLSDLYKTYVHEYRNPKQAMQRICMAFDIYFNDSLFNACDPEDDKILGKYFRQLNTQNFRGNTFDTNILEGMHFSTNISLNETTDLGEKEIDPELADKWGTGFKQDDYETMESHYRFLKSANPRSDSNNQEIFINDLCYIKMQQMKALRSGDIDSFNKLTEQYRKTFTQAGLKTVANAQEAEEFTLGVTIETIEKYTPAEYYKNKSLFADFDSLGEYITRFLLRPLRNLQHGEDQRDYEFHVKSDDELTNEDEY